MTLNEVINYLDENVHGDRGAAQLSEWLHELRLLRTEVAILEALRDGFREDAQKSKAENVRLRELVRDMWQTISKDDNCGWNIDANCCTSDECNVSCKYWHRMKDLGIEVTE